MSKIKSWKLILCAVLVVGVAYSVGYFLLKNRIHAVEKLLEDKKITTVSEQAALVSDLKFIKFFKYVPFLQSKAEFGITQSLVTLQFILLDDVQAYERMNEEQIIKSAREQTDHIETTAIRIPVRDSIIKAGFQELDKNPMGSHKNEFCNKYSTLNTYLMEIGFNKFNCDN